MCRFTGHVSEKVIQLATAQSTEQPVRSLMIAVPRNFEKRRNRLSFFPFFKLGRKNNWWFGAARPVPRLASPNETGLVSFSPTCLMLTTRVVKQKPDRHGAGGVRRVAALLDAWLRQQVQAEGKAPAEVRVGRPIDARARWGCLTSPPRSGAPIPFPAGPQRPQWRSALPPPLLFYHSFAHLLFV